MDQFIIPGSILFVVFLTILLLFFNKKFGNFIFNMYPFRDLRMFDELYHYIAGRNTNLDAQSFLALLVKQNNEFAEKRNDFWTTYGQITISIFIVAVITILLLTKTITGEAGLPLLSAISGFAVAKSASNRNGGNDVPPTPSKPQ